MDFITKTPEEGLNFEKLTLKEGKTPEKDIATQLPEQSTQPLFFFAPSLEKLISDLTNNNRELCPDDRETVNDFVMELAKNWEIFPQSIILKNHNSITLAPNMMNRIDLFKNDKIEVRAHLYLEGFTETIIHNHQSAFISTCIAGSYVHNLWIEDDTNDRTYYVFVRPPGGAKKEELKLEARKGTVDNACSHSFERGQSLYIKENSKHTVSHPSGKVVTIVIKSIGNKEKVKITEFITHEKNPEDIPGPIGDIVNITDLAKRQLVLNEFIHALKVLFTNSPNEVNYHLIILIYLFISMFIHLFIHSFIQLFNYSFIQLFIHSFSYSFICFLHLVICFLHLFYD